MRYIPFQPCRCKSQLFKQYGGWMVKVLTNVICPPVAFSRKKADLSAPFRWWDVALYGIVQPCLSDVRIQVGEGAEQPGFTTSRRAGQGGALTCGHL